MFILFNYYIQQLKRFKNILCKTTSAGERGRPATQCSIYEFSFNEISHTEEQVVFIFSDRWMHSSGFSVKYVCCIRNDIMYYVSLVFSPFTSVAYPVLDDGPLENDPKDVSVFIQDLRLRGCGVESVCDVIGPSYPRQLQTSAFYRELCRASLLVTFGRSIVTYVCMLCMYYVCMYECM